MRVTAIDPGLTAGWAQFDDGRLVIAGTFKDGQEWPVIRAFAYDKQALVIEVPRIYPGNSKGDPNDILELAMRAGEICGYFRDVNNLTITKVYPRTWKGQVPKEIHHGRILAQLDPAEVKVLEPHRKRFTKTNPHGLDHNMLDAIGLGLWFLQR